MEYGFISLLPVLVILIIAVATKRTLFAMTCGLTVGAIILASANEGFVNSWFGYLYASMANESFQWIAMVVAMFACSSSYLKDPTRSLILESGPENLLRQRNSPYSAPLF